MDTRAERAFQRGWRFRLKAIELRAAASDESIPEAVRESLTRTADSWDAWARAAEARAGQIKVA